MGRRPFVSVCPLELFLAVFSGSLLAFWEKVTSSFPLAVFWFFFHCLVYSVITKSI